MKRLALNFICKNESHIITRMLDSARPIIDLIVAVDTGSTDNTISLIRAFGFEYNIPTYVSERPFDNFCNSRNYALIKLKEVVRNLGWDEYTTWGFWFDCDEILHIESQFHKELVCHDLHFVASHIQGARYLKSLFFRVALNWTWVSPVHEQLECKDQKFSNSVIKGIHIKYEKKGASWQGNLEVKFLNYVVLLNKYVAEEDRSWQWMIYMGDSYLSAAGVCRSKDRKKALLTESLHYYSEATTADLDKGEKYDLYVNIAQIRLDLGEDWHRVRDIYLSAYKTEKRRAEPFYSILNHYIKANQWQIAYLYSLFSVANFHDKIPNHDDIMSQVIESIYHWKLLAYHSLICMKSGRIEEGKSSYSKLLKIVEERPDYFKKRHLSFIRWNSPDMITKLPWLHSLLLRQYLG